MWSTSGVGTLALVLIGLGGACSPEQHVGRPCEIGTIPVGGTSGQISTVASPALECPSHLCLLADATAAGTGPLCTAECASNQDCEEGETADATDPADRRCHGGFVCTWPTTVGSFACRKMCVCSDFVSTPAGGFTKPATCD